MGVKNAIFAAQVRAARAILGMTRDELAKASGVAPRTLADFESGARSPHRPTLAAIQRALEAAGVEFVGDGEVSPSGGPGVRLRDNPAPAGHAPEDT